MARRLLTTGAVAKRLNRSPSRVVQYEQLGLLRAAERDSSGRRLFDENEVERFAREREEQRGVAAPAA
jgi:DNA-binding transcriptional MerR regulator